MDQQRDWDATVGSAEDARRAFDNLPLMAASFSGPEHSLVAATAAYRAYAPKFAIGDPVGVAFPEVLGQHLFQAFDTTFETGEAQDFREWRVHVDLDGGGAREIFIDFAVLPRRGDDGAIIGVDATVQDVTERVQARRAAEAELSDITERYARARSSTMVMQQALLASSVPVLPGAAVAAEYLVAVQDTAAGGDWFDALIAPDGSLLLVVGDVVGHGIEAAAVMAQLRTAVRVHLLAGSGVAETLRAVDDFAAAVPGARMATMCIARLDVDGSLEYCTAGHPPPLLIVDGLPRFAEPTGAGPLASGRPCFTTVEKLDIGDAVLLYTDGLLERPGRELTKSTAEFASLAARILGGDGFPDDAARPVDRLCTQTLELLLRNTGYGDDVTLLAAQRTATPQPFTMVVPAEVGAPAAVRGALRDWLVDIGCDATTATILEHAVSEYVDNAARHAYDGHGVVTVEASLDRTGTVHAMVTDAGRWRAPRENAGGRGLVMANALVPNSRVVGTDQGTRAELRHLATRPAHVVTDPALTYASARHLGTRFDMADVDGVLTVVGDVDGEHAPVLAGHLVGRTHSGTTPLSVDLSAVTHLGSAAVRTLADAVALADRHGTFLGLIAPPGSTAHHVLTLVGLPTINDDAHTASNDPTT